MRKKPLLAIGMLALLPCRPAHAQDTLEYAVKFVCGRSSGGPGAPVAPGTYFTSINIHNPNRDSLVFQFKVAAPPFQFFPLVLRSDQALSVTCSRIQKILGGAPFAEGFAVFHSRLPLDVVAVYSAMGAGGLVSTEEIVRTPARTIATIPACTTTTAKPWIPDTFPPVLARHGVWGANTSDIFSVGLGGTILHFNGALWSLQASGVAGGIILTDVWGSTGSDVWVTTTTDSLLHYNGAIWSPVVAVGSRGTTTSVWGASATDVFVVGIGGAILHFNGVTWSPQISGTTTDLLSVWGTSGSDVFAVGRGGTILHYNGATWAAVPSPTANNLHDVWVASPCVAFAVGDTGTVIRYNGTSWSSEPSGIVEPLLAVWGFAGLRVYAVGGTASSATIRHRAF